MAPAFLVQVMEWREALDRARGPGAIQALADEASACRLGLLDDLAALIDMSHDWTAAAATVRALMFVARFEQEIERRADSSARLDD
jgi:molecular chaperone HscB